MSDLRDVSAPADRSGGLLGSLIARVSPGSGALAGVARGMVGRADAARDAGRHREAATLYAEALRLAPGRAGIVVQLAHMLKECGDYPAAEERYLQAAARRPRDADLAFQIGHFYRSSGRIAQAEASYTRAAGLKPDWPAPVQELESLRKAGWGAQQRDTPGAVERPNEEAGRLVDIVERLRDAAEVDRVVPELLPRRPEELLHGHGQQIELRRLGRHERTHWGIRPTVRGIEALRGFCIAEVPVTEVQVYLNDTLIQRAPVRGGYPLRHEGENPALRKYVFNIWFDFTGFVDGLYELDIRAVTAKGSTRSRGERIVVARPLDPAAASGSDGFIPPLADSPAPLADRINALPSAVRAGRRALLPAQPRTILVQRADQLGDLVVSVPALRRLRALFPDARLVGLLSGANHELASTLDLFDEIIVIDFPEDYWEQRRIMPAAEQLRLRERLAPLAIDVAIDLSENVWSRYLLLLAGAPFMFGFRSGGMPSMTVEVEGFTHDRIDNHEVVPHTNKQLAMIEWLGAMVRSDTNVVRREGLGREDVASLGLGAGERFVLMHDGARLKFSRWPHYPQLAQTILERTDLSVVMLTDDPGTRAALPPGLARSDRFRLVDRRLAFDQFDALVSLCAAFVGNDSGPKHLASFRGAKVVSLHMARNNWNEWGQENGGVVISRRVPCTGCLIHYDPEECGRDFVCMTNITVEEVFGALTAQLDGPAPAASLDVPVREGAVAEGTAR